MRDRCKLVGLCLDWARIPVGGLVMLKVGTWMEALALRIQSGRLNRSKISLDIRSSYRPRNYPPPSLLRATYYLSVGVSGKRRRASDTYIVVVLLHPTNHGSSVDG